MPPDASLASSNGKIEETAMRLTLGLPCVLAITACAMLGARSQDAAVKTRLRLVDSAGNNVPGIVRVFSAGKVLDMPGLLPRLRGVKAPADAEGWHVVPPGGAEVPL